MSYLISVVFLTYFICSYFGIISFKKMNWLGRLALISIILSLLTEATNFYYLENHENNLSIINTYELLSFPLTVSIIMAHNFMKRPQFIVTIVTYTLIWILRFILMIHDDFEKFHVLISYSSSLLVCAYCGWVIYRVFTSEDEIVHYQRSKLLILIGIFIFESVSIIPSFSFLPIFEKEEIKIIGQFYFYTLLFGTIAKNALFTMYFFIEKKRNTVTII